DRDLLDRIAHARAPGRGARRGAHHARDRKGDGAESLYARSRRQRAHARRHAGGARRALMRWVPLAGVLATLAIVFLWRPWLQRRRYGTHGILLLRAGGPAQHLRDGFAMALFALLLAQSLAAALAPESLPLAQADRRAPAALRHALGA